jgi:hypothetical protein
MLFISLRLGADQNQDRCEQDNPYRPHARVSLNPLVVSLAYGLIFFFSIDHFVGVYQCSAFEWTGLNQVLR